VTTHWYASHGLEGGDGMKFWGEGDHVPALMMEERGGGGDELEYDPDADTFTYSLGTGISAERRVVPNPRPGNPLLGAIVVDLQADREWEAMERRT
jgi:hypothetical protein